MGKVLLKGLNKNTLYEIPASSSSIKSHGHKAFVGERHSALDDTLAWDII